MMDTYQPIYDAVRREISNGDIGSAVESAIRGMDLSHFARMAASRVEEAASAYDTPSAIYKPSLGVDGNQWCALYGDDLMHGVAGFGDTPSAAMADFDLNWHKPLPTSPSGIAKAKSGA